MITSDDILARHAVALESLAPEQRMAFERDVRARAIVENSRGGRATPSMSFVDAMRVVACQEATAANHK